MDNSFHKIHRSLFRFYTLKWDSVNNISTGKYRNMKDSIPIGTSSKIRFAKN